MSLMSFSVEEKRAEESVCLSGGICLLDINGITYIVIK